MQFRVTQDFHKSVRTRYFNIRIELRFEFVHFKVKPRVRINNAISTGILHAGAKVVEKNARLLVSKVRRK